MKVNECSGPCTGNIVLTPTETRRENFIIIAAILAVGLSRRAVHLTHKYQETLTRFKVAMASGIAVVHK